MKIIKFIGYYTNFATILTNSTVFHTALHFTISALFKSVRIKDKMYSEDFHISSKFGIGKAHITEYFNFNTDMWSITYSSNSYQVLFHTFTLKLPYCVIFIILI